MSCTDGQTTTGATAIEAQLRAAGLSLPREASVGSEDEHLDAATTVVGYPMVVKGVVEGVAHKSDHGLVVTGINDREQLQRALSDMRERMSHWEAGRVVLQSQAPPGAEFLLSARQLAGVGVLITVGMGGTLVEIVAKIAVRALPLGRSDVLDMLDEVGLLRHARNWRGVGALDLKALTQAALAFADWYGTEGCRAWSEVEINPLIVHRDGQGATVVDAIASHL